jgi:hypothetical protein
VPQQTLQKQPSLHLRESKLASCAENHVRSPLLMPRAEMMRSKLRVANRNIATNWGGPLLLCLARLLARRPEGIFVAPFEQGEIGPDLFRAACQMGLEGLVSKRRDRPYQAGRSRHWIKLKNGQHPAMERVMEPFA